jgi:hypothetical protein
MKGTAAVILVLLGFLAAAAGLGWWGWRELGDVAMGMHGWVALAIGATLTLVLGVGLMWLVYYSSRHGYDDRAGRE